MVTEWGWCQKWHSVVKCCFHQNNQSDSFITCIYGGREEEIYLTLNPVNRNHVQKWNMIYVSSCLDRLFSPWFPDIPSLIVIDIKEQSWSIYHYTMTHKEHPNPCNGGSHFPVWHNGWWVLFIDCPQYNSDWQKLFPIYFTQTHRLIHQSHLLGESLMYSFHHTNYDFFVSNLPFVQHLTS